MLFFRYKTYILIFCFFFKKKIFLITGMSAGFAGLFQTPIAAIFFAIEVLIAVNIHYRALIPAIIASFTASTTSHLLGLEKFTFLLSLNINLDFLTILKLIILGIIFGLVGGSFAICLKYAKTFFSNKINKIFINFLIFLARKILKAVSAGEFLKWFK